MTDQTFTEAQLQTAREQQIRNENDAELAAAYAALETVTKRANRLAAELAQYKDALKSLGVRVAQVEERAAAAEERAEAAENAAAAAITGGEGDAPATIDARPNGKGGKSSGGKGAADQERPH